MRSSLREPSDSTQVRLPLTISDPRSDANLAVWNFIGWWLILLFVPETKALTLEELDQVFNVPTRQHASYQFRQIPYIFNRYVLRRDVGPQEMLYAWEKNDAAVVAGTTVPTTYAEKGEDHA